MSSLRLLPGMVRDILADALKGMEMSRLIHSCKFAFALAVSSVLFLGVARAQEEAASPIGAFTEEEQRQIDLADRFLTILKRNPREGTALDRIYGHHLEFGTLDSFVASLKKDVEADPKDGVAWMLLGLFEAKRGEDGQAIEAYQKAAEHRPEDPIAPYYLGQTLLRVGRNDDAIAAMELALQRDPARTDQLEIFQQLGRIHQRAQRTEKALEVWQRLEKLYPDDTRVLEQIATTLAEEGAPELALQRFRKLAELEKDDYQRTMYRVRVAELTVETAEQDAGIAEFEAILAELNPDGWLHREVRRRIENVFLRSGDQDSLVSYYEKWLESHPEDVEAMARLSQFLASSARMPEARKWMDKALTLAPSRGDLRKAFIQQLVNDQKFAEASEQYGLLAESDPDDPEVLRDWGKLVLRDKEVSLEKRQQEATRIWNKIIAAYTEDALTHAQVADHFRHADMNDQALPLYQKAVELAPSDPQYREFLGEFYHLQKQPEKAKQTWAGISAPPDRTADNLARTAEVYHSFGYPQEAIQAINEACEIAPKDFALHLKAAGYLAQDSQYDLAIASLDKADETAATQDEHEAAVVKRIEVYRSSDQLKERTVQLAAEVAAMDEPTIEDWVLLARFYEAARDWVNAASAAGAAIEIDSQSVLALTCAARIAESSGEFSKAADISRQLADGDRRSRGDHLMNVARLELMMGRQEEAIAAADDLIRSAPGNTEYYEFYSQVCFRIGKREEGLDALRKAIRINPNEPHLIMLLGSALADQFKTREAIDLYWRAFEGTDELDDKTTLITKLVPLYEQVNDFDTLLKLLEQKRSHQDQRRTITICLAQAYQSIGDTGYARKELESLLSENTRDTNLLNQLAKLCQSSNDLDSAIDYQSRLVAIAPGHETEFPLAAMLQEAGEEDRASEIFVRLTRREEDPQRLLRSLDSLLAQHSYQALMEITGPLLDKNPTNWELLYREGVAFHEQEEHEEAEERFEQILALNLPHDKPGVEGESKLKRQQQQARSKNLQGQTTQVNNPYTHVRLLSEANKIREATGFYARPQNMWMGSYPAGRQPTWMPEAYGHARMAAFGWLVQLRQALAKKEGEKVDAEEELFAELKAKAAQDDAAEDAKWDYLYMAQLSGDGGAVFEMAKTMAREGGEDEYEFLLSNLSQRSYVMNASGNRQANDKSPLPDEDLDLILSCYEKLGERESPQPPAGAQIVYSSNGQMYMMINGSYQPVYGLNGGNDRYVIPVSEELRLAGREEEANQLLNTKLEIAKSSSQLLAAMNMLQSQAMFDRMPEFYDRWKVAFEQEQEELGEATNTTKAQSMSFQRSRYLLMRWVGWLAEQEEMETADEVLEYSLSRTVEEMQRAREKAAQSKRVAVSTSSTPTRTGLQVYYGKQSDYLTVDLLFPTSILDNDAVSVLRQGLYVYEKKERTEILNRKLQALVDSAGEEQTPYYQLMLAQLFSWQEKQSEVLPLIAMAADSFVEDIRFQLQLAQLYVNEQRFEDALAQLKAIESYEPNVVKQREMLVLQVAERLGDIQRAKKAAEALFGMRVSTQEQVMLAETTQRLGLQELHEAILARAQRTVGNAPAALASMMMMYQGQGKTDEAKQAARRLLQRTSVPTALTARTANGSRDASLRRQALQLLQRTGELTGMIQDLEARIERSPKSEKFYQELAELLEVTNKKSDLKPLLEKALEHQPKAGALSMKLAQVLESEGNRSEACDRYLAVLKHEPHLMMQNLSQYRMAFQQADRLDDFAKAIVDMDSRHVSQPYYVVNLAQNILRNDPKSEAGMMLLEKIYEDFPDYRSNLITNSNSAIFENPRFFEMAKKALVPRSQEITANPWWGFDQARSYSSNGTINSANSRLLSAMKGSDKLKEIHEVMVKAVEKNKHWHGGKAMLALVEMEIGEKEKARKRLQQLIGDQELMKGTNGTTIWLLGQLIYDSGDMTDVSLQLYEKAAQDNSTFMSSQLQYSPVSRLVDIYKELDRPSDGRDMILKNMNTVNPRYGSSQQSDSQLQNWIWASGKLRELGYPLDAIRYAQKAMLKSDEVTANMSSRGMPNNYYQDQAKRELDASIKALEAQGDSLDPEALLTTTESDDPTVPAIDLMLQMPSPEQLTTHSAQSPLVSLVLELSKKTETASLIAQRLVDLQQKHPDDMSIAILLALVQQKQEHSDLEKTLRRLVELVEAHPIEQPDSDHGPSTRQRQMAALSLPLWLVVQQIEKPEHWDSVGNTLASQCYDAAKLQDDPNIQMAILYGWGDRLARSDQLDMAEEKWTQLVELSTKRPGSGKRMVQGRMQIAPLTMPQFQTTMAVAKKAAENNMARLSQEAFREALAAGVPLAISGSLGSSNSMATPGIMYSTGAAVGGQSNYEKNMAAVATWSVDVARLWKGNAFSPETSYTILHEAVLPEHRPAHCFLYPLDRSPQEIRVESLADFLIDAAQQAGKLDELANAVQERNTKHPGHLPGYVLQTKIALRQDRLAAAKDNLSQVEKLLQKTADPTISELACHCAIPAFSHDGLKPAAFPILKQALTDAQQKASNNNSTLSTDKLMDLIGAYSIKNGNAQEVADFFESMVLARQQLYGRYSGDYGMYLQKRDLATFADHAGSIGAGNIGLDYLGRAFDFDTENYGQISLGNGLVYAVHYTRSLPPEERYATWSKWTLPHENRRTVRSLVERIATIRVPQSFRSREMDIQPQYGLSYLSNLSELVDAARVVGKLPELTESAAKAHQENLPDANHLYALCLVAAGDSDKTTQVLDAYFDQLDEERKKSRNERSPNISDAILIFDAGIDSGVYFNTPERFLRFRELIRSVNSGRLAGTTARFASQFIEDPANAEQPGKDVHFDHWLVAHASAPLSSRSEPWWESHDGHAVNVDSSTQSWLFSKAPLVGDFEVTFDVLLSSWSRGNSGYGGAVVSMGSGSRVPIFFLSQGETIYRSFHVTKEEPSYQRVAIRRQGDKCQFLCNGYLVYEETVADTAPWITLGDRGSQISHFRNFQVSGMPEVPQEVQLVSGNRMDGWSCIGFSESQPRLHLMAEKPNASDTTLTRQQSQEPAEFSWKAEEGELIGRANPQDSKDESWIYYQRPLAAGETFSYEFFYDPQRMLASPTVGRYALVLGDDGVKTHWLTTGQDRDVLGVESDNMIVEDAYRQADQLTLKPNEWNQVEVTSTDGQINVHVNGELAYQRPTAEFGDLRFGLFHFRDTEVKVRQAVLSGDWAADTWSTFADQALAAQTSDGHFDLRRLQGLLSPDLARAQVRDVMAQAEQLNDTDAFAYLADWVLPGESHSEWRLVYDYPPRRDVDPTQSMLETWLCPAVELAKRAQASGQMATLKKRVEAIDAPTSAAARGQAAMLALLAIEAEDWEAARKSIEALYQDLKEPLPKATTISDRMPELVVAIHAGRKARLWQLGLGLSQRLKDLERDNQTTSGNGTWRNLVAAAYGAIEEKQIGKTVSHADGPLKQWTAVPYLAANIRGRGLHATPWIYERGSLTGLSSDIWKQLFFQSPLRGKFEIRGRVSTYYNNEVVVSYGRRSARLSSDGKKVRMTTLMHGEKEVGDAPELPSWDPTADLRILVEGNTITTLINGKEIHQDELPAPPDPWVVLQMNDRRHIGTIRDLQIVGTPEIPEEINLLETAGWWAWRADYYSEWHSHDENSGAPYIKRGEELVGNLRKDRTSSPIESLMLYSRPMLEDGVIEFETFYEPGKFEIHPVLGETAYLLEKDGVATHHLTAAQWETSPIALDNRQPLSDTAPPWVENGWNKVRLTLKGDKVTINVNGTEVASDTTGLPTGERFFGLFRYSDQTECRVRNLVYRGAWPTTLPEVAQQQLAYSGDGPLGLGEEEVAATTTFDLARPIEALKKEGFTLLGHDGGVKSSDGKLKLSLSEGGSYGGWPGLQLLKKLEGDSQITVDFHDMQWQAPQNGWGCNLCLEVGLDDEIDSVIEVTVGVTSKGQPIQTSAMRRHMPGNAHATVAYDSRSENASDGKLRLVRRDGRLHCLVSLGTDQPFQLVYSVTIGDANIDRITVQAKASDDQAKVDGWLGQLSIQQASEAQPTK